VPPETGYRVEFREKRAAEAAAAGDDQTRSPTAPAKRPRRRWVEMHVAIMAAHITAHGDFVNVASVWRHRIRRYDRKRNRQSDS
jgi:hypothetical protein